jgi:tetratricopeptide (TPR) repeat protein
MIPIFFALSVFFWIFIYLSASAPGLVGGDAPELASAAFHLGSAHAPGYPLYVALGRLFELLPVGSHAFRMTFFSILAQVAAYIVLVLTLKDTVPESKDRAEKWGFSIITACLVFSGPLVFRQAVSPEVYALHFLLVAILLRLVIFPNTVHFLLAGFIAGLSLSHQHLALLILPSLALSYRSYFKRLRLLSWASAFFLIGLTPYLLLTLRANLSPEVNWGNPVNFRQFLFHLSRSQYGGDISQGTFVNGILSFYLFLKSYTLESFGAGIFLALIGLWKNRPSFSLAYYVGVVFLLAVLPFLLRASYDPENNFVNQAFLTPAMLWLAPLMLKGMQWVGEKIPKGKPLAAGFFILFLLFLTAFSYKTQAAGRNLAVEDVSRNMLKQMPARSVLFSEGDVVTFPLAYLKLVLRLRPDAEIFDRTGGLFRDLYGILDYRKKNNTPTNDQLVAIERNYEQSNRPSMVYYTEDTTAPGRVLAMNGLLFQVTEGDFGIFPQASLWGSFVPPRIKTNHDYLSREAGARFFIFRANYRMYQLQNASLALEDLYLTKEIAFDNSRVLVNAGVLESASHMTDQATQTFERACELTPSFYLAWLDKGIVLSQQKRTTEAIECFKKAIRLAPTLAEPHHRLAYQYFIAKRYTEAIQEWESTRHLDPSYAEAYRNLGFMLQKEKPDYAAEMFRQYLSLLPDPPEKAVITKWLATGQGL